MGCLFSKYRKRKFYIRDTTSNLGSSYHLISDTFHTPPYVVYTEKRGGLGLFVDKIHDLNQYLLTLNNNEIRREARQLFQPLPSVRAELQARIRGLPAIDIGVHIRMGDKITSGEMKAIALQTYIDAILSCKAALQKESATVYVMTDNPAILDEIRSAVPHVFVLDPPPPLRSQATNGHGHDQKQFNALTAAEKREAFLHFLAELTILQAASKILCTYSSNVGRYLYMTCDHPEGVQSLDVPQFTILHDMSIFLNAALRPEPK